MQASGSNPGCTGPAEVLQPPGRNPSFNISCRDFSLRRTSGRGFQGRITRLRPPFRDLILALTQWSQQSLLWLESRSKTLIVLCQNAPHISLLTQVSQLPQLYQIVPTTSIYGLLAYICQHLVALSIFSVLSAVSRNSHGLQNNLSSCYRHI